MRIIDLNLRHSAVNADAAQHDRVREWWDQVVNDEDAIGLAWVVLPAPCHHHLAALALTHDAVVVSCDTDFARFKGLRWENPLA